MSNRNKTTRTVLRWAHLLVGWLIGVFICNPFQAAGAPGTIARLPGELPAVRRRPGRKELVVNDNELHVVLGASGGAG